MSDSDWKPGELRALSCVVFGVIVVVAMVCVTVILLAVGAAEHEASRPLKVWEKPR